MLSTFLAVTVGRRNASGSDDDGRASASGEKYGVHADKQLRSWRAARLGPAVISISLLLSSALNQAMLGQAEIRKGKSYPEAEREGQKKKNTISKRRPDSYHALVLFVNAFLTCTKYCIQAAEQSQCNNVCEPTITDQSLRKKAMHQEIQSIHEGRRSKRLGRRSICRHARVSFGLGWPIRPDG